MKTANYILFSMLVSLVLAFSADGQIVRKPAATSKTGTTAPRTPKSKSSPARNTKPAKPVRTTKDNRSSSSHSSNRQDTQAVVNTQFSCDVEGADLYIDMSYMGDANGTYNLKSGTHKVVIVADGCEDFNQTITVSSNRNSFKFHLKEVIPQSVLTLIDDMVKVQGGTFKMGAIDGLDAEYDELPSHDVKLSTFYMCKYEVTQELWTDVMGSNPSDNLGGNLPVESISWNDCQDFIDKLNSLTGMRFRLPTEAEWEYAARGGVNSHGYRYAGSDSIDAVAWYYNFDETTHAVGLKEPNELGLYDMSGNVMEWCADWHGHYKAGLHRNPTGPKTGEYRVTRGGFWESEEKHCTVTYRNPVTPDDSSKTLGVRLAASSMQAKR